jgi:hypothetical protein
MLCSLANGLGDDDLGEITRLERDLGVTVLAYTCHEAKPASLDDTQLERLRELEDSLGVRLVAVAA